jgi:N-acetylneuraminic acid mutarotase
MKNISLRAGRFMALALVITGLGLGSCKKDETTTVYGNWTRSSTYSGAQRSEAVAFVINNIAYAGTGRNPNTTVSIFSDFYAFDPSKGGWSQVTSMPTAAGGRYGAVAFAANGKGYVAGGNNGTGTYLSDVWQFDPAQNTTTTVGTTTTTTIGRWTQVASLPVTLYGAVAGSINNVGYVGTGFDGSNNTNVFYQYNATANTWSQLSVPFPGDKRTGASAFVAANQLYVVGGSNNSANVIDVYSYDPSATPTRWNAKRILRSVSNSTETYDYSGVARSQAVSFTVNDKGYVALGGSTLTSCYEYNTTDDTWTLKNPISGSTGSGASGTARNNAVGFGIGNYGYVGLGVNGSTRLDDFYRFAPNDAQE